MEPWNILRIFFQNGKADAALAASIFHFKEAAIPELKRYLKVEKMLPYGLDFVRGSATVAERPHIGRKIYF